MVVILRVLLLHHVRGIHFKYKSTTIIIKDYLKVIIVIFNIGLFNSLSLLFINSAFILVDNFAHPVDSLFDPEPLSGTRRLNVPLSVCNLVQLHLLRHLSLGHCLTQVHFICKEQYRYISFLDLYILMINDYQESK